MDELKRRRKIHKLKVVVKLGKKFRCFVTAVVGTERKGHGERDRQGERERRERQGERERGRKRERENEREKREAER